MTCPTSCNFFLKTLVISFHPHYFHLYPLVYCSADLLTLALHFLSFILTLTSSNVPASPPVFASKSLSVSFRHTNFVHLSFCLHVFHCVHHSCHPISPLCPLPQLHLILTLPCSTSLLSVTLHLPVFVSPSFQEFIRRMCCFPNSIAPQQLIYSHSHT